MMHYDGGINPQYSTYYTQQSGGALPVYHGAVYQRGHRLGGLLTGAMHAMGPMMLPMLKGLGKQLLPMVKTVGSHAVRGGMGVMSDVLSGRNFGESVRGRALEQGRNLMGEAERGIKRAATRTTVRRSSPSKRARHCLLYTSPSPRDS